MHEGAAVAGAIEAVVGDWPTSRTAGSLRIEIRDATRAEAQAVAFFAAAILSDRGLDDVAIRVHTCPIECDTCRASVVPTVVHPICRSCGAPLRSRPGPAVVCVDEARPRAPDGMDGPDGPVT